jgi:nucleotide-binding universal stress UspA family protein
MSKPIVVAVDPFREDPDPLAFAALLSELTGRRLVAVGAYLRAGVSLAAEPVVIENGVGGALAAMSSDLDVLVCGSRGYGTVKSVVLGSVSHALSRHSVCPLIVLPRGSARELEELVAAPAVKATR